MREIFFRGKRIDNGEWVYGDLVHSWEKKNTKPDIQIYNNMGYFDVDPTTIGQHTGLTDKNGKRIFEGDIFQYGFGEVYGVAVVKFGEFSFGSRFDMNQVGFYVKWAPPSLYYRSDIGFWAKTRELEVIGNIHDNPDLLEVD